MPDIDQDSGAAGYELRITAADDGGAMDARLAVSSARRVPLLTRSAAASEYCAHCANRHALPIDPTPAQAMFKQHGAGFVRARLAQFVEDLKAR